MPRSWAGSKAAAACLVIAVFVLLGTAPAWADFGKRYALVIGNSGYAHVERLPNTARDAEAIAEALEALRFTVFKGIDLTGDEFERLIDDFDEAAAEADTVVFYYAGHGFQLNGLNHLAPVDAVLRDRSKINAETFVLNDVIARVHRRQRQTIVFLDACRNNPLPESAQNGAAEGLAQVGTGDGTFIAFATQPGNVSYDGSGKNSPFTEALLTHIGKPGRSISNLMIDVRNEVSDRTVGRQVPWDQSSLRADFFFNPSPEYIAASEPARGGIVIGRAGESATGGSGDAGETGLATGPQPRPATPISIGPAPAPAPVATRPTPTRARPDTVTAAARAQTDAVTTAARAQTDAVTAASRAQPDEVTTASTSRAQPGTAMAAVTLPSQPEAVRGTANFAPVERLKPAREWFPDELAPSSEDAVGPSDEAGAPARQEVAGTGPAVAPEAAAGEADATPPEERQMAALDPQQPLEPEPDHRREPLIDPQELARSIQSDLARLGCYRLSIDGMWGPGSRASLERFYREKGEAAPSLEPSTDVLAMLQDETGTVCAPPKATPPKKSRVVAPAEQKAPATRKAQKQQRRAAPTASNQPAAAAAKSPKLLGF